MKPAPSIYPLSFTSLQGNIVNMEDYRGKVLLIVNIASGCGFTPQLADLEALYQQYRSQGLEIIGFPSDDFNQEPLDSKGISDFCQVNYGTSFHIMQKSHVKGPQANPVFRFLSHKSQNGRLSSKPRWNFHKFLVNRKGEVADYFFPFTKPSAGRVHRAVKKAACPTGLTAIISFNFTA